LDAQAELDLGRPTRVDASNRPSDESIERLAGRLMESRNPVLIAGHELQTRDALHEAAQLAETLGAAVMQQTVPYASHFLSEHPAFVGQLTRSQQQVKSALQPYDLLVFLGADVLRMSVYSPIDPVPEGVSIVQIGERDWELGKNYPAQIALQANVKETLRTLVSYLKSKMSADQKMAAARRLTEITNHNWSVKRQALSVDALKLAQQQPIDPRYMNMQIADTLPKDAVVVEEGLTSTFSLLGFLPLRDSKSYFGLASGGIGFAMGGAVGISLALPDRPVVAIVGDGSAMYSVQALWTAAHLQLPITYVIPNNRGYRILKERLVSFRKTDKFIGMDLREPEIDFVALAQSLGVPAQRIGDPAQIAPALKTAVASGKPSLLDINVIDGFGT
jgi:benzoylformate decarboxylase